MFPEARVEYLEWAKRAKTACPRISLLDSGTTTPLGDLGVDPAALLTGTTHITDRSGTRAAVAARYGLPEEEVLPVLGASLALFVAAATVVRPGDHVLVESPGYESMRRVSAALGARVTTFPRGEAEGWGVRPESVLSRWEAGTRAVLVSDLHNPSGRQAGDEALARLATEVQSRGGYLLVDEVYRDFRPGPVGTARRLGGNVLISSSLTKVYGLGPLRVGWMAGPRELVAQGGRILDLLHVNDPFPVELFAVAAFRQIERLRALGQSRIARGRPVLEAWARRGSLTIVLPDGGLHAWVTLPAGLRGTEVAETLLEQHQVAVVPGKFFGDDTGVRVGIPEDPAALEEGLAALALVAAGSPQSSGSRT